MRKAREKVEGEGFYHVYNRMSGKRMLLRDPALKGMLRPREGRDRPREKRCAAFHTSFVLRILCWNCVSLSPRIARVCPHGLVVGVGVCPSGLCRGLSL